jgi:hypothetical protein
MKNDEGKKKDMPEIARGLIGATEPDDGDVERDEASDETDDNDELHEGLQQCSREMLDAAAADDHVGHGKALARFLTIHNKSEAG